jgi:hypothetical protein
MWNVKGNGVPKSRPPIAEAKVRIYTKRVTGSGTLDETAA